MVKHMHGLPLPCSAKHGLELDDVLSNTKWCDAIAKEICLMKDFKVFEPIGRAVDLLLSKGWQYAPLHWVFAIKNDLRHTARSVISGHVTTADELDKYATTTCLDGVKLQLYLTARSGKKMVSGDVGSAYLNSYTKEKILTSLGPEFGENAGPVQVIKSCTFARSRNNMHFKLTLLSMRKFHMTIVASHYTLIFFFPSSLLKPVD